MDDATMRRRVAEARVGRLATVTPAGAPHVVPCCFVLSAGTGDTSGAGAGTAGTGGLTSAGAATSGRGDAGDVVYSAVDGKPKSTLALRRLANVRAHPATALLVDHYDDDWSALWWIRLDGTARVLEPAAAGEHAEALDLLAAKYPQYRERRPPGAVVALDVVAWRAWAP